MADVRDMARFLARSGALQKKQHVERRKLPDHSQPNPPAEPQIARLTAPVEIPSDIQESAARASKFGPRGKQRYTILGISVSPEEKKMLKKALKGLGHKNLSEWAREVLFKAAGVPIPPRREPVYERR